MAAWLLMKVLCAWCLLDGKPAYLGEREPLEDPAPTHSICSAHQYQVLESLPSRSFPEAAVLIVVCRNNALIYEHFQWSFAHVPGVKVIVDRRMGDRRSAQRSVSDERRRVSTRRLRKATHSPLGGYAAVRFTPRVTNPKLELPRSPS
jgi:hypothetical protein